MTTPATLRADLNDMMRATPQQRALLLDLCVVRGLYGPLQPVPPQPQRRQPYTRGDGKRFNKRTGVWS